jgi:large subunit ribosomal protein L4
MEAKVLDFNGKDTGRKVQLSDSVFGRTKQSRSISDVKQYLLIKRQGTHKAKERAEVAEVHVRLKKQKELVPLVR